MSFERRNYRIPRFFLILALAGGALAAMPAAAQSTIYRVAPEGATSGSCGANWSDPCDLQYVLSTLASPSTGFEVWVAAGTYLPGIDRPDSFQLRNGVAIYGGFTGTESVREQRDPVVNLTTLSGNIGLEETVSDNSYHVVTSYETDSTAVLDGFTITGGYGGSTANGAGMYNSQGSPTLANLIFHTNSAYLGGGLYTQSGNPALTNVTFASNLATRGGGMYSASNNPILTNVTFSYNRAVAGNGGGMYNANSNPLLVNVTLGNNSAQSGGGMFNTASSPTLINVTIGDNGTAAGDGSGMVNTGGSHSTLTNVILWNNGSEILNASPADTSTINYSVVEDGCPAQAVCSNIITADPLLGFMDTYYGGTMPTMALMPGSSAIDAGDDSVCPDTDQRGVARPQASHCDIGAYEYQSVTLTSTFYASTSTPTPTLITPTRTNTPSATPIYSTPTRVGPSLIYVKSNAAGVNNGTSWVHAFTDLQVALAAASNGDEIWVAAGTYRPATGTDRNATFQLKNNVALYGGFTGNETSRGQRNPLANVTALSGDLNGDDSGFTNNSENVFHVVKGATGATLDGFRVTGGNANLDVIVGGGLYNYYTNNLTLRNIIFVGNSARDGGGMYNHSSSPTLTNVTFLNNSAAHGAGLYNIYNSSPQLTDVTFSGNLARDYGGGMFNYSSSPKLTNVTFINNSAVLGGGLYNAYGSPILMNSSFTGNSARSGGGLNNWSSSQPILTDVDFSNNTAEYYGAGVYNNQSNPKLTNVTFTNNSADHNGGGMWNTSSSPVLKDVTFSDNSANFGGGMENYNTSHPSLVNVSFLNNSASYKGGGMSNTFNSNPMLTNVTFSGNSVSSGHGGGMDNDDSDPNLTNVTFSNNRASTRGGGMHNITSNPSIHNTIFWGNTAPSGPQLYNYNHTYGVNFTVVSDSVVQAGCPAETNCSNIITTDPQLGVPGNYGGSTHTIPLQPGSSAIDTGDDSVCPDTDQRGVMRPQNNHCDIGAFEYLFSPQADISVWIGTSQAGSHSVENGRAVRVRYPGMNNGPATIMSTNMRPLVGSEAVIYKVNGVNTSFSETMALPASQLDTTYWLPWYNNVELDTQLRFANVSNSMATVQVFVGGQEMQGSPFTLGPGASIRKSFLGVNNGPVKIVSNQIIVAAERVIYKVKGVNTSFSEMMALPSHQLNTTYWLPWYNNIDLDTQLRFANVNDSTAAVWVYINGVEMVGSPFTLAPGASTRKSFPGVNNGPVKIVSNQTIVVAERVIYKVNGIPTSFSEMMGLPNNQLNTTYWLPWYNNVDLDTQLRFGNVSSQPATVRLYIGGQEMIGSPFTLQPGESTRKSFAGINGGAVQIVSDQNIVAAERVIYKVNGLQTSFSEMMGFPNSQLDMTYWFPWYNNVDLDTQLRFGVP
jgi:hypothetical protein